MHFTGIQGAPGEIIAMHTLDFLGRTIGQGKVWSRKEPEDMLILGAYPETAVHLLLIRQ